MVLHAYKHILNYQFFFGFKKSFKIIYNKWSNFNIFLISIHYFFKFWNVLNVCPQNPPRNLSFHKLVSFLLLSLSAFVKSYISKSCSLLYYIFGFFCFNSALVVVLCASFKSIPKSLNLLNSDVILFINLCFSITFSIFLLCFDIFII